MDSSISHLFRNIDIFDTSWDRGSRGASPQKPALQKVQTVHGTWEQRASVRPVQKTGNRHRKQESPMGTNVVPEP